MDASTVFVIALLIFAASLASYGLSLSPVFRGNRGLVITGFSVGAALLLGAVVLVVVSTQWWSALRFAESDSAPHEIPKLTDTPFARSGESPESLAEHTFATSDAASSAPMQGQSRLERFAQRPSQSRAKLTAVSAPTSGRPPSSRDNIAIDSSIRLLSPPGVSDPWAVTRCVVAVQPDPAEPTRWWLENECGMAVAILFSACAESLAECARGSTSWQYPATAMLLPPKPQRSVTYAEQTQHGEHIRYVACAIATENVAAVVGQAPQPRSTRAELEDFTRANDECLARVERWADRGTRSGSSIDVMLGRDIPGQIRSAR